MFDEPSATVADLQAGRPGRAVDPEAFMVLLTIGITTMAGTPEAIRSIYGIDLSKADERGRFADALADIIGNGLFETPTDPTEND